MANAADHVTLSSGQILFADPTQAWTPANFPDLPPTALSITTNGTIAGRNINKLTLPNTITYQNYESVSTRPPLIKSLVVNASGDVAYDDPKVSLVSTSLTAYGVGITGFGSPAIGAPGISSSPPDTLTNAIAKLDGWITNNLLKQPPAVTLAQIESTSLYAGVRWLNFPVYNVLQYDVPYTSGIVLLLGDPSTSDYLTLELTNNTWFPDRQYVDGLASDFYPIVRLRIFNDFFLGSADTLYSKAYMQANCVKIINESGIYTIPNSGKVFAIQNSVAGETYTTLNLYLPQIPTGTQIPVRVLYINKTQSPTNLLLAYTSTTTMGAPSAPSTFQEVVTTPTSFTLRIFPPAFSDETHFVSSCFLSSYNIQYSVSSMNTAHVGNLGFRYGEASPDILPSYLSSYINSTFTRNTPVECGPFQDVYISGLGSLPILPGLQWSTSVYATNSAQLIGSTLNAPITVVSAYPSSFTTNISSASLIATSPWAALNNNKNCLAYPRYNNGWYIGDQISTSVLFISTPQLTNFAIESPITFNDYSYPGCRSNVTFQTIFKDVDGVEQTMNLTLVSSSDDFTLGSNSGVSMNDGYLSTILYDQETSVPFQKFFYTANVTAGQVISTISHDPQFLTIAQSNFAISGYTDPIIPQQLSTTFAFVTEPASTFALSSINITNHVTNLTQISGLFTPTKDSELYFNMNSSNFMLDFVNFSSFGMAQLYFNSNVVGPLTKYTSSVYIYNESSELTTLPLPGNTILTLSSCGVRLTSDIYQDPSDPLNFDLYASVTPANPVSARGLSPFVLGSSFFVDTVSQNLYSTFTDINTSNGQRILSLLPRYEVPGTSNNMNDGISASGMASNGLNVSVSSFFIMGLSNNLTVSSSVVYNNTSSISSFFTNPYSRELLFTNGHFTHPGGLNFSQYDGAYLGESNAMYPNFNTDLQLDVNYGNRYASFVYKAISNVTPTSYQFINIRVRNPSAVSTITNSRDYNYAFPNQPVIDSNMPYAKVRMHVKILGAYNSGVYIPLETAWINCFKEIDYGSFDDSVYDTGGCAVVSTSGADVYYKVQFDRRYFTSIYPIVRVGISRDGSAEVLPPGSEYMPITFDGLNVNISDF